MLVYKTNNQYFINLMRSWATQVFIHDLIFQLSTPLNGHWNEKCVSINHMGGCLRPYTLGWADFEITMGI
jgi:hypothetical protein